MLPRRFYAVTNRKDVAKRKGRLKVTDRPTMRPRALLLALLGAAAAGVMEALAARRARFVFPEAPRPQEQLERFQSDHNLLVDELSTLGFEAFDVLGANYAADKPWEPVVRSSNEIDLVWSVEAAPPLDQLELPMAFAAKINRLPGSALLSSSQELYQHLQTQQKKHGKFFFNFVPAHFQLPRDRELLLAAIPAAAEKARFEPKLRHDRLAYQRFLLTEVPSDGNEDSASTSSGIFVNEAELEALLSSSAFKDKRVLARNYIEPFLLDQHKFTVGFYVLVAGVDPLRVYVFDHPKIKVARGQYPRSMESNGDQGVYTFDEHLAPWDLPALRSRFYELPSPSRPGTNAWRVVKDYMRMKGIDTARVQSDINAAIAKMFASNRGRFEQKIDGLKRSNARNAPEDGPSDLTDNFFELLKFDFELDDSAKPWLVKVHSNPSLKPRETTFGTDEAIVKRMLFDLLNLVGVHPQAKLPFDKFFHPTDAKFCSNKCHDKTRAWDSACWSCPGWFPPYIARRLFEGVTEYTRRGQFNLVYPDLDKDFTTFLDSPLSEHDVAFDRYIKSISASYSDPQEFSQSERKVVCVYREHCSNHGDCVNGVCSCEANYEGNTCYIPKDPDFDEPVQQEQLAGETADHGAREAETWKEKVENFVWKHAASTTAPPLDGHEFHKQDITEARSFSGSKLTFALVVLSLFLFGAYRVFLAYAPASVTMDHDVKLN